MAIKNSHAEILKSKEGRTKMTDVVLARELVKDIGGHGRVNEVIYAAYKVLNKMFPHEGEAHKQWSERRLRRWWNRETENVLHWQMDELYQAACKAKEERKLIAEARREHAEFIAKTARLEALLQHQDEAFHSPQIDALHDHRGDIHRTRD